MSKQIGHGGMNAISSALDPGGHFTKQRGQDQPTVEAAPAIAMPDEGDAAVKAAKRRKLAAMKARGGRESTILAGEDRLGG